MKYEIVRSSYYERCLKSYTRRNMQDELDKIELTVQAISDQQFTDKMNPHPINWKKGNSRKSIKVIDVHADYDLVILYTKKGKIATLEAVGTHKDLGIKVRGESFNSDDIVDKHLLEFMESVV